MENLELKGLHVDELQKLRVMDSELATQTTALKNECGGFVGQIADFQKMTDGFIALSDEVSKEVEKEKIAVLGARNRLKSVTKAREQEQQQLHALIVERKMALERLRVECEALQKIEAEQNDFIEQLILQQ